MSSITHNSIETEEIIKALRKENESLRMMGSPVVEATIQHQALEIMTLKQQVAELREALEHYGWHEDICDLMIGEPCTCGLDEALARTAKEE